MYYVYYISTKTCIILNLHSEIGEAFKNYLY